MTQMYTIKVTLDKSIDVTIRIPQVMDALELKALMLKAEGLFKLSSFKQIVSPPKEITGLVETNPALQKKPYFYSDEEIKTIRKLVKKQVPVHTIAHHIGRPADSLHNKIFNMRREGLL